MQSTASILSRSSFQHRPAARRCPPCLGQEETEYKRHGHSCMWIEGVNDFLADLPLFQIKTVLSSAIAYNRLPFFCAALVGGYSFLQRILEGLALQGLPHSGLVRGKPRIWTASLHFVAAFFASWFSLQLLNTQRGPVVKNVASCEYDGQKRGATTSASIDRVEEAGVSSGSQSHGLPGAGPLIGKTLDLTLLVAVRALDAVVVDIWSTQVRTNADPRSSTRAFLESVVSHLADAVVFAISAGAVMWAWFYLPDRLPRSYNAWIAQAAQIDQRLIDVLRRARWGVFVYGKDTGQASILQSMCKEYAWPIIWGDPEKTVPIPCEIVHCGSGPSCHWHAVTRFFRAFRFALAMYLPLQLVVRARSPSLWALKNSLSDSVRSSAFLGAFISLFYYSVCLSRTVLGPKIFSRKTITPMMWDSGLCVSVGCMTCGWSILIEAEKRRQEVAFFVAPRAIATFLPRQYPKKVCSNIKQMSGYLLTIFSIFGENSSYLLPVQGYCLHMFMLSQQEYEAC